MTNADTNQLKQQIDFGFQAEAFLRSEIGQYLVSRAEDDIANAVESLKTADPEDAHSIRAIQNQIKVAETIQYWLADAITAGENAQNQFIDQHE